MIIVIQIEWYYFNRIILYCRTKSEENGEVARILIIIMNIVVIVGRSSIFFLLLDVCIFTNL